MNWILKKKCLGVWTVMVSPRTGASVDCYENYQGFWNYHDTL
jgi:hypothetical protein